MKGLRISVAAAAMCAMLGTGTAQNRFTIAQLLSAPFTSELIASPGGKRIAWLVNDQGRRNVWAAEGPRFRPRRLTSFTDDDGQDITQLTWSPDGETIAFVRGGGKNSDGESPNPTHDTGGADQAVWAVNYGGGLPRKLGHGIEPEISFTGEVAFV